MIWLDLFANLQASVDWLQEYYPVTKPTPLKHRMEYYIIRLFHDLLRPPSSHHHVCSVITAHNLTPIMHDGWNAFRVCLSHACPRRDTASTGYKISTFQYGLQFIMPHNETRIYNIIYEGRSINKLQNGAIPLILKIGKIRNIRL